MTSIESPVAQATQPTARPHRSLSDLIEANAGETDALKVFHLASGTPRYKPSFRLEVSTDDSDAGVRTGEPCWLCVRDLRPQYCVLICDHDDKIRMPICVDCACADSALFRRKAYALVERGATDIADEFAKIRANPLDHRACEDVGTWCTDLRDAADLLAWGFSVTLAEARRIDQLAVGVAS